jgi:hypothetical protein
VLISRHIKRCVINIKWRHETGRIVQILQIAPPVLGKLPVLEKACTHNYLLGRSPFSIVQKPEVPEVPDVRIELSHQMPYMLALTQLLIYEELRLVDMVKLLFIPVEEEELW